MLLVLHLGIPAIWGAGGGGLTIQEDPILSVHFLFFGQGQNVHFVFTGAEVVRRVDVRIVTLYAKNIKLNCKAFKLIMAT